MKNTPKAARSAPYAGLPAMLPDLVAARLAAFPAVLFAIPALFLALPAPCAAEQTDQVVAGLSYAIAQDGADTRVQAVRVRRDTGQVLVRYTNGKTGWVDAAVLTPYRQPVAAEAGNYLFVAAALACLLAPDRCEPAFHVPRARAPAPGSRDTADGGQGGAR